MEKNSASRVDAWGHGKRRAHGVEMSGSEKVRPEGDGCLREPHF